MPRSSKEKCRKVARKLDEEAGEEPPYDQLSREKIKEIAWDTLQFQERVIDKYMDLLERFGYIEHVFEDMYRVHAPDASIGFSGRRVRKSVGISKEVADAAENIGINLSACLEDAILEELDNYEGYVSSVLGDESVSSEEAKVIFKFITNGVYKSTDGSDLREEIYSSFFGEVDENRIRELRALAFRVAVSIGVEQQPDF